MDLRKNTIFDLLHDNCLESINPESSFQFYNVSHLWADLLRMEEHKLSLVNFVTEPIRMGEIVSIMFPGKLVGSALAPHAAYDIRTLHSEVMRGADGYLSNKATVLNELKQFVQSFSESTSQ